MTLCLDVQRWLLGAFYSVAFIPRGVDDGCGPVYGSSGVFSSFDAGSGVTAREEVPTEPILGGFCHFPKPAQSKVKILALSVFSYII